MKSNMKYTVILSAYHVGNTATENLINTEKLAAILARNIGCDALRAVGVWQGTPEQSFVIHTNSSNTVNRIVDEGLNGCAQQCVLVSNNRKNVIQLHNQDGTRETIGERFASACIDSLLPMTVLDGQAWTVR